MAKFLIYLFESGLCLTLFYIGYIVFFRKETYFTFNRIYLLASMVLALLLPLIPMQFDANETEYISVTLNKVGEIRNYYEDFVYHFDAEYDAPVINDTNQNSKLGQSFVSSSVNIIKLIFYIYIIGLLFFSLRLLSLIYSLFRFIRRNNVRAKSGYSVVYIKEEAPSFSFLKWIFVNEDALKPNEFEQVLAHEKVHVQHKHSVDLILAHIITMFQWFNPLTWRIQKSLKTCHEYIADRQVINQGHELFDYQSLLLSQLISIRSVELVNNFNLLSIKKRIAMMNKIKSGRIAQLKAVLVIPIIALAFIFFANCTKSLNDSNESVEEGVTTMKSAQVNLPSAKEVKEFDNNLILFTLTLDNGGFFYNDTKHDFDKIEELIASIVLPEDNAHKMTVLLNIDKSVRMEKVDLIKQALRKNDLFKIGYLVDGKVSQALFMLLPPINGMILDESKFKEDLYTIDQSQGINSTFISKDLTRYINNHNNKYIMLYKYDNNTTYAEYMDVVDVVFHSINNIRRVEAKKDNKEYDSLEGQEQKVYRRRYPIRLSQRNTDIE